MIYLKILTFIKSRISVIAGIVLLLSCQIEKTSERYNVLFVAIDDLRTEINCYGAGHIKSPNIDRLASEGVRFTEAHVQQAICMASRASIMSGIRPEKNGIYTGESVEDLIPDALTLNRFFQQNGYNIASCGKIYHHGIDTKQQFGDDEMTPKASWTGRGYVTDESIKQIELNTEFGRGPAYECANVHDTIYKDGINAWNAVKKLEELKEDNKPFFLAVGFSKPHLPFVAPKKYWDLYPESSITLPDVRERPENSSMHTMRIRGELNNYYGMPHLYEEIDDSTTLVLRRAYYACVSYADAQVGYLLDQLDELGLRENTIVVLWGDHGYKLGDYNSWCKWSNMNIDTNIPFIFSVPEGHQGSVCETPVEALDIYPTLAELCGLTMPEHLEGQSLVDNLNNPVKEQHRYVSTIWPHDRWNYDKTIMGYSIKDSRFNYVEWVKLNTGEVLARELYDHENDPLETRNVVDEDQYKESVAALAQKCKDTKEATDHDHNFKSLK